MNEVIKQVRAAPKAKDAPKIGPKPELVNSGASKDDVVVTDN